MTPRFLRMALASFLLALPAARAQQQGQPPPPPPPQSQDRQPPKPPDDSAQESTSKKHNVAPGTDSDDKSTDKNDAAGKDAKNSKDSKGGKAAKYDPYPAEQDVEVGTFYMHKGNLDAAIERFKDAIEQRPNFAKPRLLLGEAFEKKGDKAEAVRYYKEYLTVLPNAPDAKKIRSKIEKLSGEK